MSAGVLYCAFLSAGVAQFSVWCFCEREPWVAPLCGTLLLAGLARLVMGV